MRLPTLHWITNNRFACGNKSNGVGYDDKKFYLSEAKAKQALFGNFCKQCLAKAKNAKKVGS